VDAFSNPPRIPHPNVLAVATAQMSYTRDVANAEIAFLESQVDAAGAKVEAVNTALYLLSRARTELREADIHLRPSQGLFDLLNDPKTPASTARHVRGALLYYVGAWNNGQIVADELAVEQRIALRRAALDRSRRATQAWLDTIKPGMDTLVAYGAGGVDPKTVAQLLGSLGLVGTAVGVNR
jgi:hypothetical protein